MLKRAIFVSFLTIVLFGWSLPVMADESATDQAENIVPSVGTKTAGDILWHCDVQDFAPPDSDNQILGVETLRDTIYVTGGGGTNHTTPNKVYVWSRQGNSCVYLYSVNQPTPESWGWRDIACDGQYLYASDDRLLEAFYTTPGGLVLVPSSNVNVPGLPSTLIIRAVAYDPDSNWFWTADFGNSIYAFNRSGTIKRTYANTKAIYGLAYDNTTPGGPYLWAHVQDSCNIYQFNPATGSYTGVVYSGWGDDDPGVSGIAGGLCVLEGGPSKQGSVTLLGITQMSFSPDEMYAMEIVPSQESLYWIPHYNDYARSGMPDFSQLQDNWLNPMTGQPSFCGPVAVANCFWWFDSKYNVPPGVVGDAMDLFPLVRDYLDGLPPLVGFDDHDPWNVDHANTAWFPGVPPPATSQPFVPGPQVPGGGLPPWGELVERLAYYFDTDGRRTGISDTGTNVMEMQQGIDAWFLSESLNNFLYERTWAMPTFTWVETLVEKSQNVILLLGFWFEDPPGSGQWFRCGGHYVTVAGINSQDLLIGISDPFFDNAEAGGPGMVLDGICIPHAHGGHASTVHNDAGNVSHDVYSVVTQPVSPGGLWEIMGYPVSVNPGYCYDFYGENTPGEFKERVRPNSQGYPIFVEAEYALEISPWEYPPDCGDMQPDQAVNASDVVYLINYLFIGGPAPYKKVKADVNHDGFVNASDVVYLINYLFIGGPRPQCYDP
jgi:hypothetical protein